MGVHNVIIISSKPLNWWWNAHNKSKHLLEIVVWQKKKHGNFYQTQKDGFSFFKMA